MAKNPYEEESYMSIHYLGLLGTIITSAGLNNRNKSGLSSVCLLFRVQIRLNCAIFVVGKLLEKNENKLKRPGIQNFSGQNE